MHVRMATQITVRLDEELEHDLESYRDQHKFRPDKSEVVRTALREYLDSNLTDQAT